MCGAGSGRGRAEVCGGALSGPVTRPVGYGTGPRRTRPEIGPTLSSHNGAQLTAASNHLGSLAEQILLVFTGPRHVAVRPQRP